MRSILIVFVALLLIAGINACKKDGYQGCLLERVTETNNPGYESIDYSYDNEGRVTKVVYKEAGTQFRTEYIWSNDSLTRLMYNTSGQLRATTVFKLDGDGYATTGNETVTGGELLTYGFVFNGKHQLTRSVIVSNTMDTVEDLSYEYVDDNRAKRIGRGLFLISDSLQVLFFEQNIEYSTIEDHSGFFPNTLPVYIPALMGVKSKNVASKVRTSSPTPYASLNNAANFQVDIGLSANLARVVSLDSATNFVLYVRDYYYDCD